MSRKNSRSKSAEDVSAHDSDHGLTRRRLLADLGAVVGVAAVASTGVLGLGAMFRGQRPSMGEAQSDDPPKPSAPDLGTQSQPDSASTIPNTTPSTVPAVPETPAVDLTVPETNPVEFEDLLFDPESLTEGQLLGVFSVTNSVGDIIIPDLTLQANLEYEHYNEELAKGAIMEVRRVGLDGKSDPTTQQGVLGDKTRITTIFAHRMTRIHENGDVSKPKRDVLKYIDQVDVGGVLTISLFDGTIARYSCTEARIYEDAQLLEPGGDPSDTHDYNISNDVVADAIRFRDTEEELVQLVACHNGVKDRIVRVFKRIV